MDNVEKVNYRETDNSNKMTDCGFDNLATYKFQTSATVNHNATTMKVEITTNIENYFGKGVGFRELSIVLLRCPEGCTSCTSEICTSCDTNLTLWKNICLKALNTSCQPWNYTSDKNSTINITSSPPKFVNKDSNSK